MATAASLRSPETIGDGSYPFSRSLYIYVDNAKADRESCGGVVRRPVPLRRRVSPQVADAGYVDLPADRIQATKDAWAGR